MKQASLMFARHYEKRGIYREQKRMSDAFTVVQAILYTKANAKRKGSKYRSLTGIHVLSLS